MPHKLGVIGAGAFTDFSLESYRHYLPDLVIAGITDPKAELAQQLAQTYQIPKIYPSVTELLNDKSITIVLVLTPPNTHNALARQAVAAGKHVLVEKPIGFNQTEAQELISAAERNNLSLSANLVLRHHPFHQQLARDHQKQRWGTLLQINTTAFLARYPENHWYWNPDISGGFFLNTFCHFLDLYDSVFHESPQRLSSAGSVETGWVINSEYSGQRQATLSVNLQATNSQELVTTTYIFEKAVIITHGWLPEKMTVTPSDGPAKSFLKRQKLPLYRKILAEIMSDLIRRIENPATQTPINHTILLQAVVNPTRAAQNPLR